jgi:pyruvate/2-oxoacid:ferredoxin oxidoreductase beta subunit
LIDKESAVEAVVEDFFRSGRTFVEEYEKKHITNRRMLRHEFEEKMKEVENSFKEQKRAAQYVRGKANKGEDPEKETRELEKRHQEIGSRLKEMRLRSTKRNE